MSGLTRKKIKVRSKSGKTYQRSVMVKAGEQVKRFVSKHKRKLVAGAIVGGVGLAAAISAKRSMDRAATAHAHATAEAVAKAAGAWGRAAAASTHARTKVEHAKAEQSKVSEEISRVERAMRDLSNQVHARLHGRHDISDLRQARRAATQQYNDSIIAGLKTDNQRKDSAKRSGHFTEWVRPGWSDGSVSHPAQSYNIPTHRLGAGTSPPNAAGQSDPRPTAEQRRHLNVLGHQFDRSQERLSSASGERYRSAWASGHQGVLRLGSGQVSAPKKSRSSGRKRS